jgi:hypothetical protein
MAFIYGIVLVVFLPVLIACAAYGLIKISNRRRKRARAGHAYSASASSSAAGASSAGAGTDATSPSVDSERTKVREWMDPHKARIVRVMLGPEQQISLINRYVMDHFDSLEIKIFKYLWV